MPWGRERPHCLLKSGERKSMNTPTLTIRLDFTNLWTLQIDKQRNKEHRKREAGASAASIARLSKGENVTTDTILQICQYLNCSLSTICEIVPIKLNGETD